MPRRITPALLPLALALAYLPGCEQPTPPEAEPEATTVQAVVSEPAPEVWCDCTLSSWVVAFRGRHLHLDIDCPEEYDHLDGRVEFTSAALRPDYDLAHPEADAERVPHLVRMTPGRRLMSFVDDPAPRTEAEYRVPLATAAWFQRDIAFSEAYVLTGANSNAAMRVLLERADLEIPPRVSDGGGAFGEFPGIGFAPGSEVEITEWPILGLPQGPRAPRGDLPEWARTQMLLLGRMGHGEADAGSSESGAAP